MATLNGGSRIYAATDSFEIPAENPQRAIDFLYQSLGLEVQQVGRPMDYWLISTGKPSEPGLTRLNAATRSSPTVA